VPKKRGKQIGTVGGGGEILLLLRERGKKKCYFCPGGEGTSREEKERGYHLFGWEEKEGMFLLLPYQGRKGEKAPGKEGEPIYSSLGKKRRKTRI